MSVVLGRLQPWELSREWGPVTAAGSPGDLSSNGDATPSWAECEEKNYYNSPESYDHNFPGYEESCNTSTVNTHWTQEGNATSGEGDELV